MAVFEIGKVVYANCTIKTDASDGHPQSIHATRGDKFYVIDHNSEFENPYTLSSRPDGSRSFQAKAIELMGQKPFSFGSYYEFGYRS